MNPRFSRHSGLNNLGPIRVLLHLLLTLSVPALFRYPILHTQKSNESSSGRHLHSTTVQNPAVLFAAMKHRLIRTPLANWLFCHVIEN